MAGSALTAFCGDSWESPRWAVTFGGDAVDLSQWHVLAQARQSTESADVVFEWETGGTRIVLGSAVVELADGSTITTGTVQLLIKPADWVGKPRKWRGVLDVELSSDATASPDERVTIVRERKFEIVPDVARD